MDEIVDVVDGDDAKTGVATRRKVHSSGAWHRGVHILVFNSKGELLLQRRAAKKNTAAGALDLSVSEHAKEGETFKEAAVRGLKEELGIKSIPLTKMMKFRLAYGPKDNMISVLFRGKFAGKVKLDPAEVEEVVPFKVKSLSKLLEDDGEVVAPWARQLLRHYLGLSSTVEKIG